jgi:GT2 family glycosyltransferase
LALARASAAAFDGQMIPIRMLAMFCTAFRRDLYERIGPLDERYEQGMFEDEDYALAARAAGYDIVWTPAVYIHHAYHASIGKLLPSGDYLTLFRANQARFEEKWGVCWERHRPAPPPAP